MTRARRSNPRRTELDRQHFRPSITFRARVSALEAVRPTLTDIKRYSQVRSIGRGALIGSRAVPAVCP